MEVLAGKARVASKLATRPDGGGSVPVTLQVPAGDNLTVTARAYREANPDLEAAVPVAAGAVAGVNIGPSQFWAAALTLDALFAPRITGLSGNAARPGDSVTLGGENLTVPWAATPSVRFGGTAVTEFGAVSSASVTVRVPAGAASGNLVLVSDGIAASAASFWVAAGDLAIAAPKGSWDPEPAADHLVTYGQRLQFTATATPSWVPGEAVLPGAPPSLSWITSNPGAGTLDQAGLFTPGTAYASTSVAARLGTITSNAIRVTADEVRVTLTPAATEMGQAAGVSTLTFSALARLADGSTASALTWGSSDPASVSISPAGLAVQVDTEGFGLVTISAASRLNPQRPATATVALIAYLVSTLAGRDASGSADGVGANAQFATPVSLVANPDGTIFVADLWNSCLRAISPAGAVSTFAGRCGEGGDADGPAGTARFRQIRAVAIDAAGNLLASEGGRIRRVTRSGDVSTLPVGADIGIVVGLAPDRQGNLLAVNRMANQVLAIDPAGAVRIVAGDGSAGLLDGPAASARFYTPHGIALDPGGTIFVADKDSSRIRLIEPAGQVGTLSDPSGAPIEFDNPAGVAFDRQGNLLVAERSCRIVRVTPSRVATVIAGSYAPGWVDGIGPRARFRQPTGLTVGPGGEIYVADPFNHRIRKIVKVP